MCRSDDFPPYAIDPTLALDHPDHEAMHHSLFRELGPSEVEGFRTWARANWQPGQRINPLWHPVIRDECQRMIQEREPKQHHPRCAALCPRCLMNDPCDVPHPPCDRCDRALVAAEARAWDPRP